MMTDIVDKFFYFVRYSICHDGQFPALTDEEWEALYELSRKQSVSAFTFRTVEYLGKDATIPRKLKLKWFYLAEKIRERNALLNRRSVELVDMFRKDGFDCCVLKGQGNAALYPHPTDRTSGDIDLFVMPSGRHLSIDERRQLVIDYARKRFPRTGLRYLHINYPVFSDAPVELHFFPTFMNNPLYNHRILTWMEGQMAEQCQNMVALSENGDSIPVPTYSFNIVYQLSHMMRHFFDEGIGLRQFLDYYFLLSAAHGHIKIDKGELERLLRHLGLRKFAGATMYIMREVFNMEDDLMIVPVDERRGRTLMAEILRGGNFGQYSGLRDHSAGVKYIAKIWRNLHFVREYPAEALSEPFFRTWHFFWRLRHK